MVIVGTIKVSMKRKEDKMGQPWKHGLLFCLLEEALNLSSVYVCLPFHVLVYIKVG